MYKVVYMEYTFSEETIEEIRDSNDIVDIISSYLNLKRTGSNFKALCPFHTEKTPSFIVSPQKQIFHCFGCGEGGDVIKFVMKYENLNFVEAVKLLADKAGITLENDSNKENQEIRRKKEKYYKINREAAIYFYNLLKKNKKAQDYLASREIGNSTIKAYGLGYSNPSWDDLLKYLVSKGYELKDIESAGLIVRREGGSGYYDRFRGRIIFPILDVQGRIIAFGGRVIDNSLPKYLNSPETPIFSKRHNIYGLNIAKNYSRNNRILLVEGYMDVISLYKNGLRYCVASLGTALTEQQARLLKRYSNTFYICYDSDGAGQKATDKAIDTFLKVGIKPKVVVLPEGKDPDEFIKKNGKEVFEDLMDKAFNYIDYKIYINRPNYDFNTVEGKVGFSRKIAQILSNIKSPIEVDAYIKRVSEQTGISEEAIKNEVFNKEFKSKILSKVKDKYIFNSNRYNNKNRIKPVEQTLEPGHLIAEKSLIKLIINSKTIYNKIKGQFKPDDFLNTTYKKLAMIVYDQYENDQEISIEKLIDYFDGNELKEVSDVFNLRLQIDNNEEIRAVEDYIKKINYYKLKIKREEIKQELKILENSKEKSNQSLELFKKLCLQLMEIDKELKMHQ